ncbi:hypothetical protein [Deinococcus puniceus]|uniref:hypothetical protein n=1 Tax=Deinococcus puniceus TaxID=1182568 RepID=UPI0012F78D0D|nr:hypothetical protein [Deinococcus puniceus]
MTYWAELVELYEYKVADALDGRVPRGGKRSLTELRDELLGAPLEPMLLRRMMECDRNYRNMFKSAHASPVSSRPAANAVPEWSAPARADSPESQSWEELQRMAWHVHLKTSILELAQVWGRQPDRTALRVMYTVQENAEREGRSIRTRLPVPAVGDPLVSLHDAEVVARVASGFADLLLTEEGRLRVKTALSAVHEEPFARHPDEDVMEARLAAAERERVAPEARAALVAALRAQYPQARDPRERPAIREAARHLQRTLDDLLAGAPTNTMSGTPSHSILYAQKPQSALPTPDDGTDELVIYLAGGQAAHWRGMDLRWQPIGSNWQLQFGPHVVLLRTDLPPAERSVVIGPARAQIRAFVSGAYVLLRVDGRPDEEIGRLASKARAIALLLNAEEDYANLRLARAAAQLIRNGTVDTAALGAASADKYASAPPETLIAFARKGIDALMARLQRSTPSSVATSIHAAAERLELDADRATGLHEVLHIATFTPEPLPYPVAHTAVNLADTGAFRSILLGQDPVTLRTGERALTLRLDYKGELAAVLPGHPAATLHDLLVVRVPGLSLLLVRQGTWLAAAALYDTPPPSTPEGHTLPGTLEHKSSTHSLSHTMHAPYDTKN